MPPPAYKSFLRFAIGFSLLILLGLTGVIATQYYAKGKESAPASSAQTLE